MCRSIVTALCLIVSGIQHAGAQSVNEPSPISRDLETRVRTVVAERWGVEPSRVELEWGHVGKGIAIDPDVPFDIRGRNAGTNFTVVFSIRDRPPIAVGLRAGLHVVSPIATRPLTNGHIIAAADVAWSDWVEWGDNVHDADVDRLPIGWRVRTSIAVGQPVRHPKAVPPPAVRAGSTVEVVWSRRAIVVRVLGIAMHDAAIGERIRVRLEHGRGSIRGIVNQNGYVELSEH